MKRLNESGFTLLELLIVLSIWSVLLLLVVNLPMKHVYLKREKEFLNTFQMDVLYAQSLAMGVSEHRVQMLFKEDNYQIVKGTNNSLIKKRSIPKSFELDMRTINEISFDEHGRMRSPGHFIIKTAHTTYRIIFPIGKGRCYVVEI